MDKIDVVEQDVANLSINLLEILLSDKTTGGNIKWATDSYQHIGPKYNEYNEILPELIIGNFTEVIQPRVLKDINDKQRRTKETAEVFTPSWMCNRQNNMVDEAWFGSKNVFNYEENNGWRRNDNPIVFPKGKIWTDYIYDKRLEMGCGEGPYMVSRYDTVTGNSIDVENRIGIIDRKFRVISENVTSEEDWYSWVKIAFQSTYAFEYQGDNLLIARENMLFDFIDNMKKYYNHLPSLSQLKEIANIIAWNFWQMDGITQTAPYSEQKKKDYQVQLFSGDIADDDDDKEPVPCRIYDWRSNKSIEFRTIIRKNTN